MSETYNNMSENYFNMGMKILLSKFYYIITLILK